MELKEAFKLIEATLYFQEEENRVENFHHYFYTSLSLKSEINLPTFSLR